MGFWVRHMIRLALPMAGSRLIQMLTGFVGMIMLAHMGPMVLAASMLITSAQVAVVMLFISLLFSISVVVGQAFGAKNFYEVGSIFRQGCVLGLMLCIPLGILFWFIDRLLLHFGQLPALVIYIREYFHALIWAIPGYMILAVFQQTCYGIFKQRLIVISNSVCLFLFAVVAYGLIYGRWGFPKCGVAGFSYAAAVQVYANILILIAFFCGQKALKPFAIFSRRRGSDWRYLRQIFSIGWPMSLQFGGELLGLFVVSIMIGWLGTEALAAAQVTQQCLFLFIVPLFAVAEATGILVSQAVGSQQQATIKPIGKACVVVALGLAGIVAVCFVLFPKLLASFYLNIHDPNNALILHLTRILFALTGLFLIFSTLRDVMTGALRGLYDTRFAMWIGIFIVWFISVPIGYLLGFPAHLGVVGFRLAGILAFATGAFLVYRRWQTKAQ